MDTLAHILEKFQIRLADQKMPIDLPAATRTDLAALFSELGFKVGAEIGTESGLFSEVLLKSNRGLRLYCVDAWKAYRGYRDHVTQAKMDGFFEAATRRLQPYDCELIRQFSMDAVKRFESGCLDFVYIDANHGFNWVVMDVIEWAKRVRAGGIVSNEAEGGRTCSGEHEIVEAFAQL